VLDQEESSIDSRCYPQPREHSNLNLPVLARNSVSRHETNAVKEGTATSQNEESIIQSRRSPRAAAHPRLRYHLGIAGVNGTATEDWQEERDS
jgi:hypothetical protein